MASKRLRLRDSPGQSIRKRPPTTVVPLVTALAVVFDLTLSEHRFTLDWNATASSSWRGISVSETMRTRRTSSPRCAVQRQSVCSTCPRTHGPHTLPRLICNSQTEPITVSSLRSMTSQKKRENVTAPEILLQLKNPWAAGLLIWHALYISRRAEEWLPSSMVQKVN